jgi:Na+/H+ antiporter NhaD/arsenite permease-like protein
MTAPALLIGILVLTLALQAWLARRRLLVVLTGAGTSVLVCALYGLGDSRALLADVPWDVLVLLVSLGLLSEIFVEARLFAVLAVRAAHASRASARGMILIFGVGMYVVSALMNNLTALLLVLPVVLVLFRVVGVTQRQAAWTLGTLVVACNLGGAATPIGDFPAILLLSRGSMGFVDYLSRALPATAAALVVVISIAVLSQRSGGRPGAAKPLGPSLSLSLVRELYRNVRLDRRLAGPVAGAFAAMMVAWVLLPASGAVGPELVAWLGVVLALAVRPALGERLIRQRIDVEAVLFLLALFVMVVAVRRSGVFGDIGRALIALPLSPAAQLVLFLLLAGLLTGVFSAGPAMAALLEVAAILAQELPPNVVYVSLALAVCAGSSLFLTAATAGPLAQSLTERAALRDRDGEPILFGFRQFVPVGLVCFAVIEVTAIGYALLGIATSE